LRELGLRSSPANLCVARRQRCPHIASSSRLDLTRNTYARDLLYFPHGLLGLPARNGRCFTTAFSLGYVHEVINDAMVKAVSKRRKRPKSLFACYVPQVCSASHPALIIGVLCDSWGNLPGSRFFELWWAQQDSNLQPADYELPKPAFPCPITHYYETLQCSADEGIIPFLSLPLKLLTATEIAPSLTCIGHKSRHNFPDVGNILSQSFRIVRAIFRLPPHVGAPGTAGAHSRHAPVSRPAPASAFNLRAPSCSLSTPIFQRGACRPSLRRRRFVSAILKFSLLACCCIASRQCGLRISRMGMTLLL
jgi:hypothetical protein